MNFLRQTLNHVDLNFGIDLSCVFTQTHQLSDGASQPEWLPRSFIINSAPPGESQWFGAATICDPTASGGIFGMLQQEPTADVDLDSLPR